LVDGGVDGILVLGSTGEFTVLDYEDKLKFAKDYYDYTNGRVDLYFGSNCPSFEDTVKLSNEAIKIGYKGVMVIGPYYFGTDDEKMFIYYNELAKKVGITAGTSQNSNGGWLKFAYMGKVEFVAKKTIRYGISWNSINNANAVTGKKTIDIGGKTYKIRLMKGKTEGKQSDSNSYQGDINKGSEWNKLMLPIHQKAPSNWSYKNNVNSPTENWNVGYTDNDLFTNSSAGNGSYSWCQEYGESTSYRVCRGYGGVSYASSNYPSLGNNHCGWRPVLELVR
ncbi:MAG: dihydrodipicolinate synthase family protein, partial [Peptoniphilus harei]|nr:dihydrodipicolinate synthase family protein [Peptoniphilus harei]